MQEDQQDKVVDYLRRVAADLRRARQRIDELESKSREPIAIVGMGCRFPGGVSSPEGLWDLVSSEGDAISGFPADRGWDLAALTGDGEGHSDTHEGGFLYEAGDFDAGFFGISPREALGMDPQQRLLLEVSWEALERAGIDPLSLRGSQAGVFVGSYHWNPGTARATGELDGHALTGTAASVLSGRLAYTLGLEGPALTVDTACSSSLVALHVAMRSLRDDECSLAVVGGVTVLSDPAVFVEFSKQGGLAPDGRCKAFSDAADGTGWSEGVGALVVERLSDARRNGHPVLAVLRGSAVNQDGASNGLTAPNGPSQQRVIRQALANAGLSVADVDAVEAHGTGTRLGDPIEAQALLATYGQGREVPLRLGSLKSNIGHTQAAAGVAGVIKMVMAMRHGVLPKSLHSDTASSHVDWSAGAVELLTESVAWPAGERPRRCAVSSFGVSGTNAHAVLEEAPRDAEPAAEEPPATDNPATVVPWVLSGRAPAAVRDQAANLLSRLDAEPGLRPVDVGYSLASRSLFEHRAVMVGAGMDDLREGLGALAAEETAAAVVQGVADIDGKTVFVFPGQGSQWVGMGARLLEESPVFAERLAECAQALGAFVDWSLTDVLRQMPGAPSLERVDVIQPASFAVMVSLAALWQAHGVSPDAVVGHSQGEIAAAVVSGALSLEDGARVVALRSQAIGRRLAGRGGMMSVGLPVAEVEGRLGGFAGRVSVAAVNGPRSVVVSGDPEGLDELFAQLTDDDIRVRRIAVDYASHSAQVEDLHEELLSELGPIRPRESDVPFVSTVSGEWLDTSGMDAEYWYGNLRNTVRFEAGIRTLLDADHGVFVEVSSHPVLAMAVQDVIEDAGGHAVAVGTLRRYEGDLHRFLTSLAEVYVRGVPVDWRSLYTGTGARRVDLPTYPFQHERLWAMPHEVELLAAADPADTEFWAAVEREDLGSLTSRLHIDEDSLAAVLPALSSWRRERREQSALDAWRYRVAWSPLSGVPKASLSGTWLVVTAEGIADDDVVTALTGQDAAVRRLVLDDSCIDRAVLAARLDDAHDVAGIVSVLAAAEQPSTAYPQLASGLALTVSLVQALGDTGIDAPLWCLTRGAVSTGRSDLVTHPVQAQVHGVGWTAALEHPQRWGGLVDLPDTLDERAGRRLAAVLAGTTGEDQLAIRSSGVFTRRVVRAAAGGQGAGRGWRPHGTTLITGGSGALAPDLARWLAAQGAEHLVLVSRRGPAAPGATELIAELAELGTEAEAVACDISDRDAVAGLLSGLGADGRAVRTVVHAAAVIELESLAETTMEEFARVVHAKVAGARHLDELLDDEELDAFVLFSSITGMWGSGRHAAYGAGNAYLSALADHRRARGATATSLHWGKWPDDAEAAQLDPHQIRRSGLGFIDAGPALAGMRRALDDDETVLAIADVNWDVYHPIFTSGRPTTLFDEVPEVQRLTRPVAAAVNAGAEGEFAARLRALPAAERDRLLLDLVRGQAATVLGHASGEAFPERRAFRDVGFDSVTSVDLRNRLVTATGLRLPSTLVFDYPTPLALAEFLRDEIAGTAAATAPAVSAAATDEPIAIVGMSCRYPGGAHTPEDLWRLLVDGADVISEFPADRGWDADALFDPDPDRHGRTYSVQGGFLHEAAEFDASFFGISPREAVAMDPQQRLLLETAHEALERAGIDPDSLRGSPTGTFIGATYQDYTSGVPNAAESETYMATGTASSVLSGRVSYLFGLEGPAVTVDTACSSSLVALHLACQSLRNGESTLALAGGVAVMSTPSPFIGFSRQRALAVNGHCKPFSDDADGMTLAEGVGLVLLERLSDARRNGHRVLAVVRGSAINQDGASNGLTAPNGPSQQRVIRQALANAGVSPADVDVVEAHGTGTKLGDPIEAQALLATYGQDRETPLRLGSLKANIGHTQAAAGVASVIKMVMALREGVLPRTVNVSEPSSRVDWSSGAVELLTETEKWQAEGRTRRAGVSSFGISGTNAHLILEQAPDTEADGAEPAPDHTGVVPWLVSAKSDAALRDQAARLLAHVGDSPELPPVSVGWSLATTRPRLEHRAVLLGETHEDFTRCLEALATAGTTPGVVRGVAATGDAGPVFVFPGQGSQWWGMGRELLETSEVFRSAVDDCAEALAPHIDWSLRDVLAGTGDPALLERVDVVQPALFSMMVALSALWRSHGVEPAAVMGHSQGEIAAACVAGALSLPDAAAVVALRSKALLALSGRGGMMSVAASVEQVTALLGPWGDRLSLAAVNGPSSVVVSGDPEALAELKEQCATEKIRARMVAVDYASHGSQVELIQDELADLLASVTPRAPKVPFYSTVTGERLDTPAMDGTYWYTNLRQTVQLERATRALLADGHRLFVETSPHPVLAGAVQETAESAEIESAVALGSLRRDEGDTKRFLTSLAEAHVQGAPVDWRAVFPASPSQAPVELPTYAFQRRRYWPEAELPAPGGPGTGTEADTAFWGLVENGDLDTLAGELGVAENDGRSSLGALLPALSAWRTKSRQASAANALRYKVDWTRLREPGGTTPAGTWLVVAPARGADDPWATAVIDALGPDTVRVDVEDTDRDVLTALLAATAEGTPGLTGVVSLLGLAEERHPGFTSVPDGLAMTLALVQALGDAGIGAPLWCLTRDAVAVGRDDKVTHPVQGALWGLGLVTALEQPGRWGGLIDLPDTVDPRTAARLRAVLAAPDGEDQLALRASGSFGRRLVHAAPGGNRPERRWWERGTVLITGGTGGLGGRVARWITERGARHVVLTSRRGPEAPGAEALRAELEGLGAQVTIAACDAADRVALHALLAGLPAELPLTAVVHAAGVADGDADAQSLTLEQLDALLRSKLTAALHLHEATSDLDLDAFVLFSSGAGIWGSGGQAGYAAANAFLDTLAEHRRARGLTATAVSWGAWAEAGMATVAEVHDRLSRRGVMSMEPSLAIAALQQSLTDDDTQVTVTDMDWELFTPSFTATRPSPLLSGIPEVRAVLSAQEAPAGDDGGDESALRRRLESLSDAERGRALLDVVRVEASATLGHEAADAIPADRAFRDVGFDSVTAIELRNRLRVATGLALPAALVFDYPTPTALAQCLRSYLFPDTAPAQKTDDPDAHIREALTTVPISRLRKAGLLDMVLQLANEEAETATAAPDAASPIESIDDMDAESLLRLATESTTN
ncbi:Erythronolide synthase, modules 1 and 2 [Streptomyces netropsis]|nr:Erythronolide synthase, modules 1 and 2 [Streptomyces netropsis]